MVVYSINWPEHLKHLEQVFDKLKKDQLFAKMSKFAFVVSSHQPGQYGNEFIPFFQSFPSVD